MLMINRNEISRLIVFVRELFVDSRCCFYRSLAAADVAVVVVVIAVIILCSLTSIIRKSLYLSCCAHAIYAIIFDEWSS